MPKAFFTLSGTADAAAQKPPAGKTPPEEENADSRRTQKFHKELVEKNGNTSIMEHDIVESS